MRWGFLFLISFFSLTFATSSECLSSERPDEEYFGDQKIRSKKKRRLKDEGVQKNQKIKKEEKEETEN